MTWLWRLVERRLRRRLPPEDVAPVIGDLLEDYASRRRNTSRIGAAIWLIRESRSLAGSYRHRAAPGPPWAFRVETLASLGADLRLGVRLVRRQPVVGGAVILTLALAIAANTALFSVVDGLLFRPLPFPHADAIVSIDFPPVPDDVNRIAAMQARNARRVALRAALETSPLFEQVAHGGSSDAISLGADATAELGVHASGVSAGFFHMLGLAPALGREFDADDERAAAAPGAGDSASLPVPVILGHAFWLTRFGGDTAVVGRRVELADRHLRVVGVMGPDVRFPDDTNVWSPPTASMRRQVYAFGRLAPGVSIEALAGAVPELQFTPLRDAVRPGGADTLVFLLGAGMLLLLVAWVQVAALVFARGVSRAHEIGVRLALGGSRLRLLRQGMAESAVLAASALALAWAFVPWLATFIAGRLPEAMTRGQYLEPDLRTLLFAAAASASGLVVMSALPLAIVRRISPARLLRSVSSPAAAGTTGLRHAMLVAQIGLTVLLVYLSGLAAHSFVRAATYDYGFDAGNVLLFSVPPLPNRGPEHVAAERRDRERTIADSVDALEALPDVLATSTLTAPPLRRASYAATLSHVDGEPIEPVRARMNYVTPGFVRALGARLIEGSSLESAGAGGRSVAMVNETLARRLAPGGSIVGCEIRILTFSGPVVGVVADLVDLLPGESPDPHVFMSVPRGIAGVIAIRTRPPLEDAVPSIRTALNRIWDNVPARRLRPMVDDLDTVLTPWRGRSVLLGLIAGLSVPLAAIGLAGALMYSVRTRTRETAIRLALGAEPRRVRRAVVGRALALTAVGLVLGLAGGMAAGRLIASQLFEVQPVDAWTIALTSGALSMIAWAAAFVPATRAGRIDPSLALREG